MFHINFTLILPLDFPLCPNKNTKYHPAVQDKRQIQCILDSQVCLILSIEGNKSTSFLISSDVMSTANSGGSCLERNRMVHISADNWFSGQMSQIDLRGRIQDKKNTLFEIAYMH